MKICSVQNCGRKVIAKGLCNAHYCRLKNSGRLSEHRAIGVRPKGEEAGRWNGGMVKGPGGRWMVYCPDYPGPKVAGVYVLEYRLRAEKMLGRRLKPTEVVHHPEGDPTDPHARIEVVDSQSAHAKEHNLTRTRNERGQFTN